jgi:alanine racemase
VGCQQGKHYNIWQLTHDDDILLPMINLYDILKAANGQLFGEPAANLFTDFCLDPQQAGENKLFVALRTDIGDTHQYIQEAIQNGASGILCVEPPTCDTDGVSVLMVRDTIDAMMEWSHYTLAKLGVQTVAVSGSSGKSSAVDAIYQILSTKYKVQSGNIDVSGKLSIPLSLASLTSEHDYVVLKLSATFPGEMAQMVEALQPGIVVVTNIDCVHPAAFENCKQYVDEQAILLENLSPSSLVIVNYDDDRTRELASRVREGVTVKTVGIDRFGADVLAFNIKVGIERIGFDIRYDGERHVGRWSPILGMHQLYGLLAGIEIASFCDVPLEDALRSLTKVNSLPGRLVLVPGKNGIMLVDDTFAASHASTVAALDWMKAVREDSHRTFFVIGDIDGLGKNMRFGHRSVGQQAADIADIIITQGLNASLIGRAAIDNGKDPSTVHTTYSTQDVIHILESYNLDNKDIVLVKGGSSAGMERVVEALLADKADAVRLVRQDAAQIPETAIPALRPSWIEVDADVLARNVQIIKELVGESIALMAVVKADAYGHGAVLVARTALVNGVEYLGVASMAEAVELRDAGIDAPILVLSYAPAETVRQAHRLNITLTVFDMEQARLYDRAARFVTGKLKVHIKIDTGMGRLGLSAEEAVKDFRYLQALSNLDIEGIYTHFAVADEDPDYTAEQIETFLHVVRPLKAAGIQFKYTHAANSSAILANNENKNFNLVRPGLILYGLPPAGKTPLPEGIKPALTWKTTVLQVKTLPLGYAVGYGNTYKTRGKETIAILPVGYADGLRRSPRTWQYVLIHGKPAPLVGRVSMEKCAVNVSDIPNVTAGDEVVLLGQQGNEAITAEMIAQWLETINYEVVTSMIPRIPRR